MIWLHRAHRLTKSLLALCLLPAGLRSMDLVFAAREWGRQRLVSKPNQTASCCSLLPSASAVTTPLLPSTTSQLPPSSRPCSCPRLHHQSVDKAAALGRREAEGALIASPSRVGSPNRNPTSDTVPPPPPPPPPPLLLSPPLNPRCGGDPAGPGSAYSDTALGK